jgi:hypothetical protein
MDKKLCDVTTISENGCFLMGLSPEQDQIVRNLKIISPLDGRFVNWENLELMQFIGLQDKEGNDIYEGDIVKTETEKAMQVSWNCHFASFCLDRAGWMFTHYFGEAVNPDRVEVIGNIHETPELLK